MEKNKKLAEIIANIPQQPQVQYSLAEQIHDLIVIANKVGLYDASDYLHRQLEY